MSNKTKVVVTGSGHNLFLVSETGGTFYVYKDGVSLFGSPVSIGEASSMDKALLLIKAYTGTGQC